MPRPSALQPDGAEAPRAGVRGLSDLSQTETEPLGGVLVVGMGKGWEGGGRRRRTWLWLCSGC